jgi:anti-sigma regulatory factor (Ser/Thr protein kinase)
MNPASQNRPPGAVDLAVPSSPKSLAIVRGAVERMAKLEGFDEHEVGHIVLAIDEALANVIKHSYRGAPDRPIHVRLEPALTCDGGGLIVTVRDYGQTVDPARIKSRDLHDVRPGGLGVHIIHSVMDEVEYSCPAGGGMQLRMIKYCKKSRALQS